MKTGNTSAHEFASRISARGYWTIGCVATATTLAFALNAGVLAQGTNAPRNTRQTEGQSQPTLARLIVPITGTMETATPTPPTDTQTLTTPPETPTIPTEGPATLLAPEILTVVAASTPDVTGSFSIRRFARTTDDGVAAVGTLTLSITDPTSSAARAIVTELAMPISRPGDRAISGAADAQTQPLRPASLASPSATTQQCETLSLLLGSLRLDVAGNPVQLNETSLEILVMPGTGERLRNVLCEVSGLINGSARPVEIVRKLNTLLDTIG
jgi:hypothetical protein